MYPMYNITSFRPNKILNHMEATVKPCVTCIDRDYSTTPRTTRYKVNIIPPTLSHLHLQNISHLGTTHLLRHHLYSTISTPRDVAALSSSGSEASDTGGFDRNDLFHKLKEVLDFSVDIASEARQKANLHTKQLLDTHPYLRDVIPPLGVTIMRTIVALTILPRILIKIFFEYPNSPVNWFVGKAQYEKIKWNTLDHVVEASFGSNIWGALEVPLRDLIIFIVLSQIGVKVAPKTVIAHYNGLTATIAVAILCFLWFLNRCKATIIVNALSEWVGLEPHLISTVLTLYDMIIYTVFVIVGTPLAYKVFGVSLPFLRGLWTAGFIGGLATTLASGEILNNIVSWLLIRYSRPFAVGDTIKVGSVEGTVIDMRLLTTSLQNPKKEIIVVPNSMLSSQVIKNESRVGFRPIVFIVLVQIDEFEKIRQISKDIQNMMTSYPKVSSRGVPPYCYLSRVEKSFAELTFGCNLNPMSKELSYIEEQNVLLQSIKIIKNHGATLASS